MFHESNNLFFERQDSGQVKIIKYPDDAIMNNDGKMDKDPIFEHIVEIGPWCSVISTMSKGNEHDLRWFAAQDFHNSVGPIKIIKDV